MMTEKVKGQPNTFMFISLQFFCLKPWRPVSHIIVGYKYAHGILRPNFGK